MKKVVLYALFAALATLFNVMVQLLATRLWLYIQHLPEPDNATVVFSMTAGTLAGLLLKYVLDKRHIFTYKTRNIQHDGLTFLRYSSMGLITTLIFWIFEMGFHVIFHTESMRYIGACLGLALGYWLKYALDRRFVFTESA